MLSATRRCCTPATSLNSSIDSSTLRSIGEVLRTIDGIRSEYLDVFGRRAEVSIFIQLFRTWLRSDTEPDVCGVGRWVRLCQSRRTRELEINDLVDRACRHFRCGGARKLSHADRI